MEQEQEQLGAMDGDESAADGAPRSAVLGASQACGWMLGGAAAIGDLGVRPPRPPTGLLRPSSSASFPVEPEPDLAVVAGSGVVARPPSRVESRDPSSFSSSRLTPSSCPRFSLPHVSPHGPSFVTLFLSIHIYYIVHTKGCYNCVSQPICPLSFLMALLHPHK
jgi:hypothetical protein